MENFVKFVKNFRMFEIARKKKLTESYGNTGESFESNINDGIKDCKIFNIDDKIKKLLVLTKIPKNNDEIHLPFDDVFIDVSFTKEEMKSLGIDIGYKEITGILVKRGRFYHKETRLPFAKNIRITICSNAGYDPDDPKKEPQDFMMFDTFNENNKPTIDGKEYTIEEVRLKQTNPKARKFIHNFVLSFINFVNNQEITIVETKWDEKANLKREKKGKCRIPPQHFIRLTGELKRYVDSIGEKSFTYSHRFWVRGTYRHFRSPKFKNMRGQTIWIPPFKKGSGLLIDKEYDIKDNPDRLKAEE